MVQARRLAAEPDACADGRISGLIGSEAADGDVQRGEFPGASATDITQATEPLRDAHRPHHLDSPATRASIQAGDAYVPLGQSRAEGRMREFDFFAADSWRVDAERDHQRRRALRPGATRSIRSTTATRR